MYLEAKVIPNLVYASKVIGKSKTYDSRSTTPSVSTENEVSLQLVSELSADELQALESIYLLICYLVSISYF